jgi:hypothetical protein
MSPSGGATLQLGSRPLFGPGSLRKTGGSGAGGASSAPPVKSLVQLQAEVAEIKELQSAVTLGGQALSNSAILNSMGQS